MMLKAKPLKSTQVELEPLRPDHAAELAPLLGDAALYRYIGGEPPSLPELRARFERQSAGISPDGRQAWLNWVMRTPDTHAAAGTVQATVSMDGAAPVAEVAWVVATIYQGRGLAKAAAGIVVNWLREQGVHELCAHVNPENGASAAVAASIGLSPTEEMQDGERTWRSLV